MSSGSLSIWGLFPFSQKENKASVMPVCVCLRVCGYIVNMHRYVFDSVYICVCVYMFLSCV